ncbi:MAG: WYL domain-containing protein [Chitinophagaceae bacterium]|nr:WYL domain-containing protein [Chitinophagaceae bacterium]MCW5905003.1 WYL domain-containing protein [Chitinophagaceae bacterium]
MSKVESISRYFLIVKKLRKQHSATFEEIANTLFSASELQGLNLNISKRTFDRDRNDILTIFNIDIKYDFHQKVYCIDKEDEMKSEAIERFFENLDIVNALNVTDSLADFVHLEKRKPQGTENLYGLLDAIKNKVQIKFSYQKFYRDTISERTAEPYALKEFKNRWYLLAKDVWDKNIKTYALDRLTNLKITKTKFTLPNDFDIVERFRYCFGIISAN